MPPIADRARLTYRSRCRDWPLACAQFKAIHLFFQSMERGITNFAAVAHGQRHWPRGSHGPQTQGIAWIHATGPKAVAIDVGERRLQFNAKRLGERRAVAVKRSQRRSVGGSAHLSQLSSNRIVIVEVEPEQ